MSNYIVLIKQVPDVSQITDNAFNPETGTLVRSRLPSVVNELDTQALALANHMRISSDSAGRVVCLTMGPPMAREVLGYGLSRCADTAVLLTDRSLAGADTWATANPIAYAIRRIVKELFGGSDDYYVVAGMQSVDGDTAQVPAQMAEELGVPCVSYVTSAELKNGRFEFTRIISGGNQIVTPRRVPCVLTVAKYEYPVFATFAATRWAKKTDVLCWGASDISAAATGVAGSKTRVIRVFPPGKSTRRCEQITDPARLAEVLVESFRRTEESEADGQRGPSYVLPAKRADKFDRSFEGTEKEIEDYRLLARILRRLGINDVNEIDEAMREKILAGADGAFHKKALGDMLAGLKLTEPSYSGDVWVVAEHDGGRVHTATLELIGKARDLADSLEVKVGVVIAGERVSQLAEELIAAGADRIYVIEDSRLAVKEPGVHRKAIADALGTCKPQIALFGATPWGRVLAPMVSYRLGCGLTADCTGLEIKDSSRRGQIAILMQTRPALGGNVMATICTKDSPTQMATARPGVMKKLDPDPGRKGEVINHTVQLDGDDVTVDIIKTEMGGREVDLGAARVIISGGKGLQNRDAYEQIISSLCASLSEKLAAPVDRGATRAAVEQGFIERAHQVGQTGTSVAPKVYVALGISGAIQHMIGISNSETIVAVNNDPEAPILKQCDYYMLARVEDVVPQVLEKLKQS